MFVLGRYASSESSRASIAYADTVKARSDPSTTLQKLVLRFFPVLVIAQLL
jgi:hypothetical protein